MKGFDNRYKDFPDFILGITREIWEDRGLGPRIRETYDRDVIVRMPGGISTGVEGTVRSTLATLHEFPDRVLLGEDVIWSGDPEAGMLSSHRILSTATHSGDGAFGTASGTPVRYRAIADCYAKDGVISDEWLVRDNGAIVRQLGHDPADWARGVAGQPFTPALDIPGPYTGSGNDNEHGAAYADLLTRIMSAELSVIPAQYDRACHLDYPGGVTGHGPAAADRFWLPLRAAFPSATFEIHHRIGRDDAAMPPRAALRWSLTGPHDGWGAFGAPTGAPVHVMGISHAEFGPRGLRREWTLYDEVAIWSQIHQHTGLHSKGTA